jgi:hypothetical protein
MLHRPAKHYYITGEADTEHTHAMAAGFSSSINFLLEFLFASPMHFVMILISLGLCLCDCAYMLHIRQRRRPVHLGVAKHATYSDMPPSTTMDSGMDMDMRWIAPLKMDHPLDVPSRLLSLPAELRLEIYDLTVLSPEAITLPRAEDFEPSLLRVNKQLRMEASRHFYRKNSFNIRLASHDWKLSKRACRHFRTASKEYNIFAKYTIIANSLIVPNWADLQQFLQEMYLNNIPGSMSPFKYISGQPEDPQFATISSMKWTLMTLRMRRTDWSEVTELLEYQRQLLMMADPRWEPAEGEEVWPTLMSR